MKSKKLLMVILSSILALGVVLTTSIVALQNRPVQVYKTKIASAEKFLSLGDYDNAILELKEAIKKNDSDPEPYLLIADAYLKNGRNNLAVYELKQGWNRTRSMRIKLALTKLGVSFDENGELNQAFDERKETGSTQAGNEATLNDSVLTVFARKTYSDYSNSKTIEKESINNGVYTVSYVGLPVSFSYYNSDRDMSVLNPDGKPKAFKLPTEISVKELAFILPNAVNKITFEQIQTMNINNLRKTKSNEWNCTVVEFESFDCRITIQTDENGDIISNNAKNKIVPLSILDSGVERTLRGRVVNVTNSDSVINVLLRFRAGINVKSGAIENEIQSVDGSYSIQLSPGEYTVEISATGYLTEYFPAFISGTNETTELSFGLSPMLSMGEIRIVLEWGANPVDLDSHLTGTSSNGTPVNIYFENKSASSGGAKIAQLDLDDTDGYGPETTTIYDSNGVYEFKVHHYEGVGSLNNSGAVVKIYVGGQTEPTLVTVPSTLSGIWWNVCTIRNGQLTINEG